MPVQCNMISVARNTDWPVPLHHGQGQVMSMRDTDWPAPLSHGQGHGMSRHKCPQRGLQPDIGAGLPLSCLQSPLSG